MWIKDFFEATSSILYATCTSYPASLTVFLIFVIRSALFPSATRFYCKSSFRCAPFRSFRAIGAKPLLKMRKSSAPEKIIAQKCLHFQRKSKLAMVAIFFMKKTSIRNAHFQFSFMPAAKKWQITPICFSASVLAFFCQSIIQSFCMVALNV